MIENHGVYDDQIRHNLRGGMSGWTGDRGVLSAEGFEWGGENRKGRIQRAVEHLKTYPIRIIGRVQSSCQLLGSAHKRRAPWKNGPDTRTPKSAGWNALASIPTQWHYEQVEEM